MADAITGIFKRASTLQISDLEGVAEKYVRMILFRTLFSSGGVAPLSGPALRSGKKYDIYLSDDLRDEEEEQIQVFIHELVHIWLYEECGLEHRGQYEGEIHTVISRIYERGSMRQRQLLEKFLVR